MTKKRKIVLEFQFEEVADRYDPEYTSLELVKIKRAHSDLTDDEINHLGEQIGQTDTWQIDRWNDIQAVLGDSDTTSLKIVR